jgi:hypothetical protein
VNSRAALIAELLARAGREKRRVFGYCSDRAGCDELNPKKGVPPEWDRLTVEGDKRWTYLPRVGEESEESAA